MSDDTAYAFKESIFQENDPIMPTVGEHKEDENHIESA